MPFDPRGPLGARANDKPRRARGATTTAETPLAIRTQGTVVDDRLRRHVSERLGRALGKVALHVERATARFEDVNGPRGGADKVCRLKVVLSGLPTILVEDQAADARVAFDRAAARCEQAVLRAVARAERKAPRKEREEAAPSRPAPAPLVPEDGSLIGRRVGRSRENLARALDRPEKRRRDQPVDTSLPGVSATDRKVGAGSTAKRNTKADIAGMTSTLEDSASGKPSRKSTRKSANRAKHGVGFARRAQAKTASPKARASRSRAKQARARGGKKR